MLSVTEPNKTVENSHKKEWRNYIKYWSLGEYLCKYLNNFIRLNSSIGGNVIQQLTTASWMSMHKSMQFRWHCRFKNPNALSFSSNTQRLISGRVQLKSTIFLDRPQYETLRENRYLSANSDAKHIYQNSTNDHTMNSINKQVWRKRAHLDSQRALLY